jgi:flap endonuclease-1
MGIKNFRNFITSKIENPIQKIGFNEINIKSVCIDINIYIYKYITAIRKTGKDIEHNGNIISHLIGLKNQINKFKKLNISIIYVFDGTPPKEKNFILKGRSEIKKKAEIKYQKTNNIVAYQQSFFITEQILNDTKIFLKSMDVRYIDIDLEADIICANLVKQKIVDCVLSTDYDILIYGSDCLIINMDYKKQYFEYINKSVLLNGLDISYNQLVDIIVLSGCDYCLKAENITLNKAYKLIKEHKSLNKIMKINNYNVDIIKNLKKAKKIFMTNIIINKKWII